MSKTLRTLRMLEETPRISNIFKENGAAHVAHLVKGGMSEGEPLLRVHLDGGPCQIGDGAAWRRWDCAPRPGESI
jgi:hypothetical protein